MPVQETEGDKTLKLLDQITGDEAKTGDMVAVGSETAPIFGYIVAYTLGEARIPHERSQAIWDARGIPIKPASHIDALKRAIARYATVEHEYANAGGEILQCVFRVRQKGYVEHEESKEVEYIWEVSQHEFKDARETQNHENLYQIHAFKKGKEIAMTDISTSDIKNSASESIMTRAKQVYNSVMAEYETLIHNISNDQIRDTLIKAIKEKDGVQFVIGRGGAWFIPISHREFVLNVKAAIKETRAYALNRLDVRIVPVVKDEDLRASIAEDVEAEVKMRFEALERETLRKLERATSEDSRVSVLQDAISEKATLLGLKDRYESLLQTTIGLKLQGSTTMRQPVSERVQTLIDELKGGD